MRSASAAGLRIDFTSRGVGVEVKIAGPPVEVRKQMQRYAASGRLRGAPVGGPGASLRP
jgi:hypothetical protein